MISLTILNREHKKEKLKKIREQGFLPGIVYGKESENLPVKVDYKNFEKIHQEAGENTIVALKLKIKEKEKTFSVLIRDVQKDPLSEKFIHVDFYELPMNEKIEVDVSLKFKGVAPAQKELGGVLVKNIQEIKIKALPKDLIHFIEVDVSTLETFEDEIKIKDLVMPPEVKFLVEPEEIVALVQKVEEEKIEEAPEEGKLEEIEVVKTKKKEEEIEESQEEKTKKKI